MKSASALWTVSKEVHFRQEFDACVRTILGLGTFGKESQLMVASVDGIHF